MKKTLFLLSLFIVSLTIYAQNDIIADSITNNFIKQSRLFPQEKLYVKTDKSYYIGGEDIWFRAFLVDAQSHLLDTTSRYVYAELINPVDTIVSRVKIRPVKGAYHGYINLPEDLPEGEYLLRFYTRFMESLGSEYFFKRTVSIGDPLTVLYRTEPKFEYEDNGKVKLELRVVDIKNNTPIAPDKIQVSYDKNELKQVRMNDENVLKLSMKAPEKGYKKSFYLEYDFDGKFHKQFIPIPHNSDFEVSFLPEGGYSIAGSMSRTAFKALNSEGFGEDIEGIVINMRGDTLGEFKSEHMGMGTYLLNSASDSVFYAICKNKDGLTKKYQLPIASSDRLALQVNLAKDRFMLSVKTPYDKPLNERSLYIVVQCRGQLFSVFKWNNGKPFVALPKKDLPSGIIQILLVDTEMNPLSERLIFNINEINGVNTSFTSDKENYGSRELVNGSIKLTDFENNPQFANLSVSITDDNDVKIDTCINILSTLLLTSDLKGYVESPAYYFSDNKSDKQNKLDLLMMTQGWSRYDIPKVLKGDFSRPTSYLELGQYISGQVKGGFLMNRKSEGYPVTLISPERGLFNQTFTDAEGKFHFMGFETPDSTSFIIQGLNKKGGSRVELLVNTETFPKSAYSLPFTFNENNSLFENYMKKADQNFVLNNGMRMIYLKDVEIVGNKKSAFSTGKSAFSSAMNPRMTHEEFDKYNPNNIMQILMRFAGVFVSGNSVSIRGGGPPLVLIDGTEYDTEFLADIPVMDIDEIEIVKDGGAAFFGSRGGNGVIMITTKRGEITFAKNENFNIKKISPLGYQSAKEFYSPQYQTKEEKNNPNPDLRTTIYWNPDLKTEKEGNVDINFYTSDASTSYSMVIEGITIYGSLVYSVQKISRKD